MTQTKRTIFVIDDEPDICEILRFNLEGAGYHVVSGADGGRRQEERVLALYAAELYGKVCLRGLRDSGQCGAGFADAYRVVVMQAGGLAGGSAAGAPVGVEVRSGGGFVVESQGPEGSCGVKPGGAGLGTRGVGAEEATAGFFGYVYHRCKYIQILS